MLDSRLSFLHNDGSTLVTNAALRRPPKATPAPSVGLHNSLAGTVVGGFHRYGGGQLLPAVGRCNLSEFQRGRIDSGGDTSAGCDTIPEPTKGRFTTVPEFG